MNASAFPGWTAAQQLGAHTWLIENAQGQRSVQQDVGLIPADRRDDWPLTWTRTLHLRLARVHEATLDGRGHGILRSSYIEGEPPTPPLPEGKLVELVQASAEVLALLHRRGLAHGALRPSSFRRGVEGWMIVGQGSEHPGDPPWRPANTVGPAHADLHALGLCVATFLGGEVSEAGWTLPDDCAELWRDLVGALTGANPDERLADANELLQALDAFAGLVQDPLEELSDARPLPSADLQIIDAPPDPLALFGAPALPPRASTLDGTRRTARDPTPYLRSVGLGLGAAAAVLVLVSGGSRLAQLMPGPAPKAPGMVVEVQIDDPGREAIRVLLNADEPALSLPGRFRFTDVTPGSYSLTVLLGTACGATCPGPTCPDACVTLSRSLHVVADEGPIIKEHLLIDRRGAKPGLLRSR